MRTRLVATTVALAVAAAGCSEVPEPVETAPSLPWANADFPELRVPTDNPMSEAKVELGRLLFYDPILSSDRSVACLTCHSPVWGMSDGLPVSVGAGGEGPIGTGRTGPNLTRRNSLTLWNAGYRDRLFWDGRVDTLEAQARVPIERVGEMGRDLDELVVDLRAIPEYVELFEAAFPDRDEPLAADSLLMALATFERTLVSDNAPYDQYARGDGGAMSESEIRGMFLFSELGCAGCHLPPLFESDRFELSAITPTGDDLGRVEVTGSQMDAGRFRVPTLRNARETWPYFHDGSVATLDEAVSFEVDGRVNRELTAQEIDNLVSFISHGLMDKSRRPRRPSRVPSGLPIPQDDYRIPR